MHSRTSRLATNVSYCRENALFAPPPHCSPKSRSRLKLRRFRPPSGALPGLTFRTSVRGLGAHFRARALPLLTSVPSVPCVSFCPRDKSASFLCACGRSPPPLSNLRFEICDPPSPAAPRTPHTVAPRPPARPFVPVPAPATLRVRGFARRIAAGPAGIGRTSTARTKGARMSAGGLLGDSCPARERNIGNTPYREQHGD